MAAALVVAAAVGTAASAASGFGETRPVDVSPAGTAAFAAAVLPAGLVGADSADAAADENPQVAGYAPCQMGKQELGLADSTLSRGRWGCWVVRRARGSAWG